MVTAPPPVCMSVPISAKTNATETLEKFGQLRAELIELAYTLDIRGQREAADVAMTTSARIAELCEEFAGARWADSQSALEVAPSPSAGFGRIVPLPQDGFDSSLGGCAT